MNTSSFSRDLIYSNSQPSQQLISDPRHMLMLAVQFWKPVSSRLTTGRSCTACRPVPRETGRAKVHMKGQEIGNLWEEMTGKLGNLFCQKYPLLVNRGDTFPIISQFSIQKSQFDGGKIQPEGKTSPTSAIYVHPNSENSHAHIWEFPNYHCTPLRSHEQIPVLRIRILHHNNHQQQFTPFLNTQ